LTEVTGDRNHRWL